MTSETLVLNTRDLHHAGGRWVGVNGLEAPNGWILSQTQGRNGVGHTEYNVTISQHVTK